MTTESIQVLHVEDNPGDALLVAHALQKGSFHIRRVDTFHRALNSLKESRPAVILLDLSLPDMDGLQGVIETLDASPGIPLLVLTGADDEVLARKAIREGAQDFLVKGGDLEKTIQRAILLAVERQKSLEGSSETRKRSKPAPMVLSCFETEILKNPEPLVQVRRFMEYLLSRNKLSKEELRLAMTIQSLIDWRLGQLAILKGYLTQQEMYVALARSREWKTRLGEAAKQLEFLSEEQLRDLLETQGNVFRQFLECLLVANLVRETDIPGFLQDCFSDASRPNFKAVGASGTRHELPEGQDPDADPSAARRTETSVRETLRKITGLATLPSIAQHVLTLMQDPEVRMDQVSKILEGDPAASLRILQLANSAAFGGGQKVKLLSQALMRLGIRGTRQVILVFSILDKLKDVEVELAKATWLHCILSGHWARSIVRTRNLPETEEAFLAGLLHDMGKLSVRQYFPEPAAEIDSLAREGMPLEAAERSLLGMTHAEIGAHLCTLWNLPSMLSQAVLYHRSPLNVLAAVHGLSPLTRIVNVSCRLAHDSTALDPLPALSGLPNDFFRDHQLNRTVILEEASSVVKESRDLAGILF